MSALCDPVSEEALGALIEKPIAQWKHGDYVTVITALCELHEIKMFRHLNPSDIDLAGLAYAFSFNTKEQVVAYARHVLIRFGR